MANPHHGLVHDPAALQALPTLPAHPKVRVLSSAQFAEMHTAHTLAHPPDGVLFPFLHGLEGDNHAQNTFFASPARRRPPPFRGLVWVVADDDLAPPPPAPDLLSSASSSEEEYSEEDDDDEDELDPMMDVDDPGVHIVRGDDVPPIATLENDADKDAAAHMHPVHHRVVQIQTAGLPLGTPDSGTGTSSACTDASFFASSPLTDVDVEMHPSPPSSQSEGSTASSGSSYASQPQSQAPSQGEDPSTVGAQPQHPEDASAPPPEDAPADPARPPLLTCTFRPRDLIRRVGAGERPALTHAPRLPAALPVLNGKHAKDTGSAAGGAGGAGAGVGAAEEEWEFRPARVPDGISLRNFGIQVPIYATLSDIVIYSPKGL
ncbi:hypothetical protein C8J57DRAFT_1482205, partial [Mycena rebaudengoi]